MFQLQVGTSFAAFNDASRGVTVGDELARILRAVADTLQDPEMEVALRDGGIEWVGIEDANGKMVGTWTYTSE